MDPYDSFVCICIYIQTYKQNVDIVGDKAKVRISKRRKQENKARQVPEKRALRISTCVYQRVRNVRFSLYLARFSLLPPF